MIDWISRYVAYLDGSQTNLLFKRWAAVSAVSAVLQRRVFALSRGEYVFPNMYVMLCGPSTAGKGVAMGPVEDMLMEVESVFVGTGSLTAASLSDELNDAVVTINGPDGVAEKVNALAIVMREFGAFLPEYDKSIHNVLTDLYDGKRFYQRRRSRGEAIDIKKPLITLLGGTTPAYLQNTLPSGAWEEGFMSRMVVVFGAEQRVLEIVEDAENEDVLLRKELVRDLRRMAKREGRIRWEPEALAALNAWIRGGTKPIPRHPRLTTYCGRRHWNLMKLCIIHAVSAGHEKIELEDFETALDLLLETEANMPEIFKAMQSGGDQEIIKEAVHFVYQHSIRNGGAPVPHAKLIRFLSERAPVHSVARLAEAMEQAGLIKRGPGSAPAWLPVNLTEL